MFRNDFDCNLNVFFVQQNLKRSIASQYKYSLRKICENIFLIFKNGQEKKRIINTSETPVHISNIDCTKHQLIYIEKKKQLSLISHNTTIGFTATQVIYNHTSNNRGSSMTNSFTNNRQIYSMHS